MTASIDIEHPYRGDLKSFCFPPTPKASFSTTAVEQAVTT